MDVSLASSDPIARQFLNRLRRRPCYGGLDLAAVSDLTAFVLVWPIRNFLYTHPWAWIPQDDILGRSHRDNVRYDYWVERGHIETTPGNITDWRFVTERIKQLSEIFDIQQIGFDRAGARDTVSDLQDYGLNVVDVGQGFLSMSPPSKRLESLVLSHRLVHCGNPVDRWCLDCTTTVPDPAGNIKPVKPDRQKSSKRIDITVARIMAIDCWMKEDNKTFSYTGIRSVA